MTNESKDGLAVLGLLVWGVACLVVHAFKTAALFVGRGWYE